MEEVGKKEHGGTVENLGFAAKLQTQVIEWVFFAVQVMFQRRPVSS